MPGTLPREFCGSDVRSRQSGFTLLELMVVTAIIGTLTTLVFPSIQQLRTRALNARAIGDIDAIQIDIMGYEATHQTTPPNLAAVGRGTTLDPWGRPYQYLSFWHATGGKPKTKPPGARKNKFFKPLNSTFDLYSLGPDGQTKTSIIKKESLDDILMANDGGFIGVARTY